MSMSTEALLNFIATNFALDRSDIGPDVPMFSSGLLDSFNMVDLVTFIESTARIKFGVLDLNLSNLDTVNAIMAYVGRTAGARA
jgi:acyl carrier protein